MSRIGRSVIFLACTTAAAAQTPPAVNPDSATIQDFERRVANYVKLHKSVQSQIHRLKPTNSPAAIEHYQHQLAHRIRAVRHGAVRGLLFTPEIAAEFRRLIGITMQGPDASKIRQSLRSASPVHIGVIRTNSAYPSGLPLQSTPPSLLLNLPPLPPEVDYRVAGRDLILRDVDANMIVDFVANALPQS